MKGNDDMQLTLGQKFKEVVADIKSAIFPDKRPSLSYIVQSVTGDATFRKIGADERDKVIKAFQEKGYDDAEDCLRAFEGAATLKWSANVPR